MAMKLQMPRICANTCSNIQHAKLCLPVITVSDFTHNAREVCDKLLVRLQDSQSLMVPCHGAGKPATALKAPAGRRSRPGKSRTRNKKRSAKCIRSPCPSEPAEARPAVQQGAPSKPNDSLPGPVHQSNRRPQGNEAAVKPPGAALSPSNHNVHAPEYEAMSMGKTSKPSSVALLTASHAQPPAAKQDAEDQAVTPQQTGAFGHVPDCRANRDESKQAPSPVPSCFKALSVDKVQELVQGLADDLNARPAKPVLEPAAMAGNTPGMSPSSAQPANCPGQAASVVMAPAAACVPRLAAHEAAPSHKQFDSAETAHGAQQLEDVQMSSHDIAEPKNSVTAATQCAAGAGKTAVAESAALDEASHDGPLVEAVRQSVVVVIDSATPAEGVSASAQVPALGKANVAADETETPASSSNTSQQWNTDTAMVSKAASLQGGSSAHGSPEGRHQDVQGSQHPAAQVQGSASQPAAAKGGSHQDSQGSHARAVHDAGDVDAEQAAEQDTAERAAAAAAAAVVTESSRPRHTSVLPEAAAAAAMENHLQCWPRKSDRRKSSIPKR